MSAESKVPPANEVGQFLEAQQATHQAQSPKPTINPEEKEAHRTEMVRRSCQGCLEYVLDKAVGKILYRHRIGKGDCFIFKYSAPSKRGLKTKFFSQWVYDENTGQGYPEYYRPERHANHVWYFPIIYLMSGKSKNEKRTFANLGLTSVQQMLEEELGTNKGYQVDFRYHPATGNVVYVKWAENKASPEEEKQPSADQAQTSEAPSVADQTPASEDTPADQTPTGEVATNPKRKILKKT